MAYLHVSLLEGSRDETWQAHVTVQQRFRTRYTQNHLRTKQFVSGTRNSSRVTAYALLNGQAGRGYRLRLSSVCEKLLSGALRSQNIARAGNFRCFGQVSGAFCAIGRKDTGCTRSTANTCIPEQLPGNAFANKRVRTETFGVQNERHFLRGPCRGVISGTSLEVSHL
jgi:hypothetical protein